MTDERVPDFWDEARALIEARPIGFLATADGDQPIVRAVTPAWKGIRAFIATDPDTAKVRQIQRNPRVNLIHWGLDFHHVSLRARASLVTDAEMLDELLARLPVRSQRLLQPRRRGHARQGPLRRHLSGPVPHRTVEPAEPRDGQAAAGLALPLARRAILR